jgi:selT/selW/selH-like putative selenoprotein
VFEVKVGGELVFSKKAEGRFPEHDEVMRAIESRR